MTTGRLSAAVAGADLYSEGPLMAVAAVLSEATAAYVVVDPQGLVVMANRSASLLFQRPVPDIVGRSARELVTQSDGPRLDRWCRTAMARLPSPAGSPGEELTLRTAGRDGSESTLALNLLPVDRGARGRWTVIGFTDVSGRVDAEAKVAHLSRAYLMLAQLNQAVIDSPDAEALFASTTRICVEQGGFLGSSVAVPTPDGRVRMVATAGEVQDFVSSLVITLDPADPHGQGPTGRALRDGRPCFVPDFHSSELTAPWRDVATAHGIGAVVALPLRTDGRVVASLSIYADRATAFDQGVAELFHQVADNVSYALDGYAAEQTLVAEVRARHALLKRLVTAEETERSRIAAGIHDDSVQTLAAVELRLGLLLRRLTAAEGLEDYAQMVRTINDTVSVASSSLRNLLFELEPPLLAQPLEEALETVAHYVFEDATTTWSVTGAGGVLLAEAERTQALRIVKEALINVRKHAGAGRVGIDVRTVPRGVELTVTDDGVGFPVHDDPEGVLMRPGHRGLSTMRDRASAAGGWLQLRRSPGGGTVLRVFLPQGPPA